MTRLNAVTAANQTGAAAIVGRNGIEYTVFQTVAEARDYATTLNGWRVVVEERDAPRAAGSKSWRDKGRKGGQFGETIVRVIR